MFSVVLFKEIVNPKMKIMPSSGTHKSHLHMRIFQTWSIKFDVNDNKSHVC